MSVLVIAEIDANGLKTATRSAISAAAQLGGEVHVLLAGENIQGIALQAKEIKGPEQDTGGRRP